MITNVKNLIKSVDFKFALLLSLIVALMPFMTLILITGDTNPIILFYNVLNLTITVTLISLVITALILKRVRSVVERGYTGKKHYLFPLLMFTPTPVLLILTVLFLIVWKNSTDSMQGWGFVIVLVGAILYIPANVVYTTALTLRIRHILRSRPVLIYPGN